MTSLYIFTIVCLFWCFSVFGHHPPFLHSFTLLRLPPSSWPCSQKGAHLIASRFRHTRWVSERIRWNGVHARTKREIEERQKEERDEGSTDTPIPQHPHLTAPEGCWVHTVRTAYKEKKLFHCALQPVIFLLKVCQSAGTMRRHMHPLLSPTWRLPTQKPQL